MVDRNAQVHVDGGFVSVRVQQVVEAIRDYSPELNVEWIPPTARKPGQAAFRIMHYPPGGEPYVIFHVKTEEEFDTRVLKKIIANDARVGGKPKYSDIEAAEKAAELVAKQRAHDELMEKIDVMYHVFKSPLNTYKVNKDLIIKDGIPFNAKGY